MITKKTKDNAGLYDTLFAQASEALGAPIRTLDEYLLNIGELRAAELDEQYSLRFSRLPIDEPPFEINANSRQIEVPSDFKKNGIAVVGDHYAEILYFTIDRYYDTWDLLSDDINIIVQWSYFSGGKPGTTGISHISTKDAKVFSAENKIMFGWPIHNIIAKDAGTIKFSVRFYKVNEGHLVFNMNTIPTSVEIKNGLNFMTDTGEESLVPYYTNEEDLVSFRFQPGLGYKGGAGEVEKPVPIINLSFYMGEEDAPQEINFGTESAITTDLIEDEETHELSLTFGLSANGTGNVTYAGYKDSVTNPQTTTKYYFVSEDEEADPRKTYWNPTTGEAVSFNSEEGATNYECIYGVTATSVGEYWITYTNTMDPTIDPEIGWGRASVDTKHVIIPGPKAPEIEAPASAYITIGEDEETHEPTYSLIIPVTGSTPQAGDVINYTLSDGEEYQEISAGKVSGVEETFDVDLDEIWENEPINKFEKTFTVVVASSRNGDTSAPVSQSIVVTYPTEAIEFDLEATNQLHIPTTISVVPTNLDDILWEEGGISYQWYIDGEGDNDELIEGATESSLEITDVEAAGNSYNCIVTNTYNNKSISTEKDPSKSLAVRR